MQSRSWFYQWWVLVQVQILSITSPAFVLDWLQILSIFDPGPSPGPEFIKHVQVPVRVRNLSVSSLGPRPDSTNTQ